MKKVVALMVLVGFIAGGVAQGEIQWIVRPNLAGAYPSIPEVETVQEWSFDDGSTTQTEFSPDLLTEDLSPYYAQSTAVLSTNGFVWQETGALMGTSEGNRLEITFPTKTTGMGYVDVMIEIALGGYDYWSWPENITTFFSGGSAERREDTIYSELMGFVDGETSSGLYFETWRISPSPNSTFVLELGEGWDNTVAPLLFDEIGIYTYAVPEPATLCLLVLGTGVMFFRRRSRS